MESLEKPEAGLGFFQIVFDVFQCLFKLNKYGHIELQPSEYIHWDLTILLEFSSAIYKQEQNFSLTLVWTCHTLPDIQQSATGSEPQRWLRQSHSILFCFRDQCAANS